MCVSKFTQIIVLVFRIIAANHNDETKSSDEEEDSALAFPLATLQTDLQRPLYMVEPKSRTLGWCVRLFLLVEAEVKVDFRVAIWSAILH